MDVSGSMAGTRISIARDAAITVINTLTFADYVQVVTFSTEASTFGTTLVQASKVNKDALIAHVGNVPVGGSTNFEAGLALAFSVLDASVGSDSGCRAAILFSDRRSAHCWCVWNRALRARLDPQHRPQKQLSSRMLLAPTPTAPSRV